MDSLFECALFVAGLAVGSFLNVCISRTPREESVVRPRSHCPHCGAPIRWHDNLPVISWLLLRGRCRDCRAPISLRYPAVELLTAILFVACYALFGPTWTTVKYCVFCFLVLGLIFMDAETGLLPREFTYTGILLGLVFSWETPTDSTATQFLLRLYNLSLPVPWVSLVDSALGALLGAAFFYLAWALYYLVRKRHGLGFGDIALMAMAGAFLGLKLAIFVVITAPLLATVYALLVLPWWLFRVRRATDETEHRPFLMRELSFGVFLGICCIAAVFIGAAAWQRYLGFFR